MPRPEIVFHPGVSEGYEEAFAWYLRRGATLALDVEQEVERCLRLILEAPLRWPAFDAKRRRVFVRKFRWAIVDDAIGRQIVVLAVAHGRRWPYYWRARRSRQGAS